jgi:hypothetical protein
MAATKATQTGAVATSRNERTQPRTQKNQFILMVRQQR